MSKFWEALELVLGIAVIIAGILAVIYLFSPGFQRAVNTKAAEIGAGKVQANKRGEE